MLLSVQGFAEIEQNSIVAEILVKHNVAAFLFSGAEYKGVSTKIRLPRQHGLIPSLQIFRIAIPQFLKNRSDAKYKEFLQHSSTKQRRSY